MAAPPTSPRPVTPDAPPSAAHSVQPPKTALSPTPPRPAAPDAAPRPVNIPASPPPATEGSGNARVIPAPDTRTVEAARSERLTLLRQTRVALDEILASDFDERHGPLLGRWELAFNRLRALVADRDTLESTIRTLEAKLELTERRCNYVEADLIDLGRAVKDTVPI